jgi:DNA-binding SARP family transcriptional activator
MAVRLFGGFQLSREGETLALDFKTRHVKALFAYLLLKPNIDHDRSILADALWPEANADNALDNLRQALHSLRKALGSVGIDDKSVLKSNKTYIRLAVGEDWWVDALAYQRLLLEAGSHPVGSAEWITATEAALELYRGDLLPEATFDWAFAERSALENEYTRALRALSEAYEVQERFSDASKWARRAFDRDGTDQVACRILMRAYYQLSEPKRSERVYQDCCNALADEGLAPDAETFELYQRIVSPTRPRLDPRPGPRPSPLPPGLIATPLVGRDAEWSQILRAWQKAMTGRGSLLLLHGEPGIGKTRLCRQLLQEVGFDRGFSLVGPAYSQEAEYLYRPLLSVVRRGLELVAELGSARCDSVWMRQVQRLAMGSSGPASEFAAGNSQAEAIVPDDEGGTGALLLALTEFFLALAQERPLCIFLDDLQWADAATGEFLRYFFRRIHSSKILLVGTYRTGEIGAAPWLNNWVTEVETRGPVLSLRLERLTGAEVFQLLEQLADGKASEALLRPLANRLHRETDGNPFFLVALVKLLFEEGYLRYDEEQNWSVNPERILDPAAERDRSPEGLVASLIDRVPIPKTTQRLIEQRLTGLADAERELLEYAAVLGRRFTLPLLQQVSGREMRAALQSVGLLLKADLLEAQGQMSALDFRHGQIREVVYRGLEEFRRRELHWRVGEALETIHTVSAARDAQDARFPDWFRTPPATPERARAEQRAPELAMHFEQAAPIIGPVKAARYHHLAGVRARYLSAYQQAVDHLEKGQALLNDLPDDPERLAQRGLLVEQLAPALYALGQRDQASNLLKDYIDLCEQHAYGLGVARTWTLIGTLLEMDSSALPGMTLQGAYERAVAACHAHGIEEEAIEPRSRLACALVWNPVDAARARSLAQGSLGAAESRGDPLVLRHLYVVLIWSAARQGDWDGVREAFLGSLPWGGPSPSMLKIILEDIESACRREGNVEVFQRLCHDVQGGYERAGLPLPLAQWYLAPGAPGPNPPARMIGATLEGDGWRRTLLWQDATGRSSLDTSSRPGRVGICPAVGCDLWPERDLTAPRLMARMNARAERPAAWVAQTHVELGADAGMQGGILLWVNEQSFLRLEVRNHAAPEPTVCMEACVASRFQYVGRGQCGTKSIWLRLEYADGTARGLCSTDGAEWLLCGSVRFPVGEAFQVGIAASSPEVGRGAAWFDSLTIWLESDL